MSEKVIGKITHYFPKIGVAVIELSEALAVGDKIKVAGPEGEFEQLVSSMQVEHQEITKAEAGQSVGLKTEQPVKEGQSVYQAE